MRTLLIVLGIWVLINVLFVVVMIPPRKPRVSGQRAGAFRPAAVRADDRQPDDDPPPSLRHIIIAMGLGMFFSLTPPLLEGYDALRRWARRMRGQEGDQSERQPETLDSILTQPRKEYEGSSGSDHERS